MSQASPAQSWRWPERTLPTVTGNTGAFTSFTFVFVFVFVFVFTTNLKHFLINEINYVFVTDDHILQQTCKSIKVKKSKKVYSEQKKARQAQRALESPILEIS